MDTRALLLSYQARLREAAGLTSCQFTRTRALQLLAKVNHWLKDIDVETYAGLAGENGYGPAIDDVCSDVQREVLRRENEALLNRLRADAESTLERLRKRAA